MVSGLYSTFTSWNISPAHMIQYMRTKDNVAIKFTVSILLIIRYDRKYFIIGLFRISIAKWRVICFRHQTVTYVYFHKPALYADIYEYRCITSTLVGHFRSRQQINNSIFPGLLSS